MYIEVPGSTHETARFAGVVKKSKDESIQSLWYGTSDPSPNIGELVLTALAAKHFGVRANFSIYGGGRSEYVEASLVWSRRLLGELQLLDETESLAVVQEWLGVEIDLTRFEEMLQNSDLWSRSLGDVAELMRSIYSKSLRFCYVRENDGTVKPIYTDARWLKRNGKLSLADLHARRGWLAGATIHYSLRVFSRKFPNMAHLVPYGAKGEVYRLYRGSGANFVLGPTVVIRPEGAEPSFLPLDFQVFATLISAWSISERLALRERLEVLVRGGMEKTLQKIVLEMKDRRSFQIDVR